MVAASERRPHYHGQLTAALLLPSGAASTAHAQRATSSGDAVDPRISAAVTRSLHAAGVATHTLAEPAPPEAQLGRLARAQGASHLLRLRGPEAGSTRAVLHVEVRDTLTRTLVWKFDAELGSAASERSAARLADALVHRLREDGLLARP